MAYLNLLCPVPDCPERLANGSDYDGHSNDHKVYGAYFCSLCDRGCSFSQAAAVISRHMNVHKKKLSDYKEYSERVASEDNPVVFANKMSEFFPGLKYPISSYLHDFVSNSESFLPAIRSVRVKLNVEVSFSDDIPAANAYSVVYFKIQKCYLKDVQNESKKFTFRRFLIGLLTGYIGETSGENCFNRHQHHNSSSALYVTVFCVLNHSSREASEVIECILVKLLNIENLKQWGNNRKPGNSYTFDCLTAIDHVHLGLSILDEAHRFFKQLLVDKPIVLSFNLLDVDSQEVPASQPERLADLNGLQITPISELEVCVVATVTGFCKEKTRPRSTGSVTYFNFTIFDGKSEVLVQCRNEACEPLYYVIAEGSYYLLPKVELETYRSTKGADAVRIVIDNAQSVQQAKVSRIFF